MAVVFVLLRRFILKILQIYSIWISKWNNIILNSFEIIDPTQAFTSCRRFEFVPSRGRINYVCLLYEGITDEKSTFTLQAIIATSNNIHT